VVKVLGEYDELALDELGPRVRVDYGPDSREWLRGLIDDLADDGLVDVDARQEDTVVRLRS
jgi:A/G-specific adenine glycosylase